ncbi:MAG: Efflux transporter, RND family, MFP subunit, partial [Candidatus Azambacteria bacterium GW2011_GWC1_46_13]
MELDNLSSEQSALDQALINGEKHLTTVRDFLARLTDAVNSAANLPASTVATYKANVNTGRTNVNTAFSNISSQKQLIAAQKAADQSNIASAEAKVNDASNSLKSAEDDLALKKAGTTAEQIAAQEAQVKQALANVSGQRALIKQAEADIASVKAQIDATQEKIKKSTLRAPAPAKIVKIFLEKREVFKPGQSAVSLSTSGYKLQADVSELDIGKIRDINGNEVLIRLDAFPGKEFKGRVVLIEQKEIIKEGDKYYRVNIYFEDQATGARSGMSGDLIIQISFKENALKIPELAVYKKGETKFVKIFEDGRQREAEIETGASDGEFIEV